MSVASADVAEPGPLERLRERGWVVAVHNDYRLDGKAHTFWLFTHPTGIYIKGEGLTDAEALAPLPALAYEMMKIREAGERAIGVLDLIQHLLPPKDAR